MVISTTVSSMNHVTFEADGQALMKGRIHGLRYRYSETVWRCPVRDWISSITYMVGHSLSALHDDSSPAGQYFKDHWVELGPESDFVLMSKPGDRVVLWARALFPVS